MPPEKPPTIANRKMVSFQFDWDAQQLLNEMTTPRCRGAFLAGLVRAEYARQQERWKRRRAKGVPGMEVDILEN